MKRIRNVQLDKYGKLFFVFYNMEIIDDFCYGIFS